jgi:L-iditol 2-dehydrogenase
MPSAHSSADAVPPKENLAVHTNPAHDLKVVETSIPEPKEGEVIIHVKATGICGRFSAVFFPPY